VTELQETPANEEAPAAPIEFRSSNLTGVNFSQRIIEVIAAPYEEEAVVEWRGETWTEVFCRGAWDGIEKRPNRVKANRDHDKMRLVGKVIDFQPSRQEGLIASVKIAQTPLGEETLALAHEDCLGASVGFACLGSGMEIDRRNRKRWIKKSYMDHLAFVPDTAYAGSKVLNVRGDGLLPVDEIRRMEQAGPLPATPALDDLREFLQGLKARRG
jgi:phage head maturation protease